MRADIRKRLRRSVAQERRIAKDSGGRRVAASGSLPGFKGDVTTEHWLVEAKQTVRDRFSLSLAVWRKIECEAFHKGKLPVLIVDVAGRQLAVVDYNDWLGMKDSLHA